MTNDLNTGIQRHLAYIWGVPRLDYMSLVRDRSHTDEYRGKLPEGQKLVDLTIQMGGCILLQWLLQEMTPVESVTIASNISEDRHVKLTLDHKIPRRMNREVWNKKLLSYYGTQLIGDANRDR